jgi:hypothetical protein
MKKEDIVFEILHALCELQELEVLWHVGLERDSAENNRVDLLAGCRNGGICEYATFIKTLLQKHFLAGKFFVYDDSVRFDLSTCTGGIAICDSSLLVKQIQWWVEGKNLNGQHRPWATGYWLPEALCGDLSTAKILYDTQGISTQIGNLIIPYPQSLSCSIANLCVSEIKHKTQILKKLLKNENVIEFNLCTSDLVASMVRLAFARSHIYFRGYKSLENQVESLHPLDMLIYELALKLLKGGWDKSGLTEEIQALL